MAASQEERTEEPTPRRLLGSRRRGEVALSRDLSSAIALLGLVLVLSGAATSGLARALGLFRRALAGAGTAGGSSAFARAGADGASVLAPLVLVPLGAMLALGVLASALQTGGLFAWQAARPDVARLSPAAGLRRLFGPRTLAEVAKGLFKIAVVLSVAAIGLAPLARQWPELAGVRSPAVLAALAAAAQRLGSRVAVALVILGILDWIWARRRHRRLLMMSRAEVKREHRETEGDPRHRAERARLHREIVEQRMVEDVRKAAFVVVNPDTIAVAVRYDADADAAPVVVAKGERLLAERIKQVAREAGVPIYRDIGLARSLRDLPEGEEIPEALYEAVAEILRALEEVDRIPRGGSAAETPAAGATTATASTSAGKPPARSHPATWKRV